VASTVGVNKLSIVNEDSTGISIAMPDVCLTPAPPAPPIPIPYPNIAQSSDTAQGTKQVTAQGKSICVEDSNFSKSSGDDAGTAGGGVASGMFQGKAEFMNYSFDTQFEGKNVPRSFDLMLHNAKNTPPFPVLQGPIIAMGQTASDPQPAQASSPSASCDWCQLKLPELGTKLKSGSSGDDVKKLQQHLKDFGMKVELSDYKDGKWQDSDDLSKGSWGTPTTRAVRMFGRHPHVADEDELVFGTTGAAASANLVKKVQIWCAKKTKSPENYWEYKTLSIQTGDRDALGSKDHPEQQTVQHDLIAQIERDLGKTGFAVHDDGLCGLKKALVPKGEYLSVPKNSEGQSPDPHLGDLPHLVAKFQRQARWLWRMKSDGTAADDAKPDDDSSYTGDVTGIFDPATAKVLHHWATSDLHMVFKKFELTDLHWPPDSSTAIDNTDGGNARLRKDAADAWLVAAKAIAKVGGTIGGTYASSPRPWKNGKPTGGSGASSAFSWHYSGLAVDLDQAFHSADGTVSDKFRYAVEPDGNWFRIWCRVKDQPKAPDDLTQDSADPTLQYRNRNVKTKYMRGAPASGAAPGAGSSTPAGGDAPAAAGSSTPAGGAAPGGNAAGAPGAGATPAGGGGGGASGPAGGAAPGGNAAGAPGAGASPAGGGGGGASGPAGGAAPGATSGAGSPAAASGPAGSMLKKGDAPFDPSPLYVVTHDVNQAGTHVVRVTAPEGWYVNVTALLEASGLKRIRRHDDWLTNAKAWEWWHYQFAPPLPPGATALTFSDYLQLIGVHEYQLRSTSGGWPAHEDVDHAPG
jgi:hypothetical protein